MNKSFIPVAVISLLIGYGAAYFITPKPSVPYGTHDHSWVVVSPEKTRVLYASWENVHYVLYVSDIDGGNVKKIAEQQAPEGSGGLNVYSITWSKDGTHITYEEDGRPLCKKTLCEQPDDFTRVMVTNSVDVLTGEKKVISTEELN